jgi:hypothetical protein
MSVSISWILTLKRIYNYVLACDKLLIKLEEKHNQQFIVFISSFLDKVHSPDQITKQTIWLPCTFFLIFLCTLLYNLKILG